MWKAHGVGYEEYCRRHSVRMEVEKRREMNYIKCHQMVADLHRFVYFNNQLIT